MPGCAGVPVRTRSRILPDRDVVEFRHGYVRRGKTTDSEDVGRLADLQAELRYLLNRWDPIGVYDESMNFPPDEYDCMIGPLLGRLAGGDSRVDLSEYLWCEIESYFGLGPVLVGTGAFADCLLAWFAAKQ